MQGILVDTEAGTDRVSVGDIVAVAITIIVDIAKVVGVDGVDRPGPVSLSRSPLVIIINL